MSETKIRVGCIIDDTPQSHLMYDLIEKSKAANHYIIDVLIVQQASRPKLTGPFEQFFDQVRRDGLKTAFEGLLFRAIMSLEKATTVRSPKYRIQLNKYPLDSIDIPKLCINSSMANDSAVSRYSPEDIDKIRARNLDVLVLGGSGIPQQEVLDICRYGVLSICHGDGDVIRGEPPAFWEVYNRSPFTGFLIRRLVDELGGSEVLLKGNIPTSPLHLINLVRLYRKSIFFVHQFLEELGNTRRFPESYSKGPYSYPLYTIPTFLQQLVYLTRSFVVGLNRIMDRALARGLRWSVAYQFADNWQDAALCQSIIIKNLPGHFLADPFVIRKNDLSICFVEDYEYERAKGKISAFKIRPDGYEALGTALDEEFLSVPI